MRLQLVILLVSFHLIAWSQNQQPITVDFLQSYYQQDGNHSAVTGGEGTESMFDVAQKMIVTIPLKQNNQLQIIEGVSYFSSASSDNVNPYSISGASSNDTRIALDATYSISDTANRFIHAMSGGVSHEMHFLSANMGYGFNIAANTKNSFDVRSRCILDIWGQYYDINYLYPIELRNKGELLPNNKRYAVQTSFIWKHILNRKTQFLFQIDPVQQFGLLSTPYHRVYFSDVSQVDIERLPNYKLRLPLTFKFNWYAADWLILKLMNRGYYDTFGVYSFTHEFKPNFGIKNKWWFYPFYRLHIQEGSKYFAPINASLSTENFYTSDYDLSTFTAHLYGAGMRWGPPEGIGSFTGLKRNERNATLNYLEFRGMRYQRTDGFRAWMISFGMGFQFN